LWIGDCQGQQIQGLERRPAGEVWHAQSLLTQPHAKTAAGEAALPAAYGTGTGGSRS
jgi:hypothetical protein